MDAGPRGHHGLGQTSRIGKTGGSDCHRRENFGKPLESICSALLQLTDAFPDHRFVFVTHPNPNAGPVVRRILEGQSRIELAPPVLSRVCSNDVQSPIDISDSGGIQEEAPTLGVSFAGNSYTTERPEAVHCGAAELIGTDEEMLVQRASQLLRCDDSHAKMANPFGNGFAGKIIVDEIVKRYSPASRLATAQLAAR